MQKEHVRFTEKIGAIKTISTLYINMFNILLDRHFRSFPQNMENNQMID